MSTERSVAHLHVGLRIRVVALPYGTVANRFEGRMATIMRISATYGMVYADIDAGERGGKARKNECLTPAQVAVLTEAAA